MKIEEFDYHLPKSLIAQHPSPERGHSRLMVLDRGSRSIEHRHFSDILDFLHPGDLLVTNDTRVLPVRLIGKKETGGKIEILLIPSWNGTKQEREWDVLVKGLGRAGKEVRIRFGKNLDGQLIGTKGGRGKIIFSDQGDLMKTIKKIGHIPLPPYIKRADGTLDQERYQTIFAQRDGAIAAPTAGLHFNHAMLRSLKNHAIRTASITLHVGIGTFAPVKVDKIEEHQMEKEWVEITEGTASIIEETKSEGKRIIAVGTTTTRALESFSDSKGRIKPGQGMTSLFITPPYRFRVLDGLITNFHLPRSTLIMLVSAFAGRDSLMEAYQEAIEKKYRFYSYGDAMLIL